MTINKPELYHIQHPLADKKLSDQVLSSYSDEQLAEYRSEHEEYREIQAKAVTDVNELYHTTRSYFKVLFGDDTKQMKYLDRQLHNGEMCTDKHANCYPAPRDVEERVREARNKYCNFLSDDNAPKIAGDDTLQEINNAVTYLMGKGLVLNTDFTISNAVSLGQSVASEGLDDELPHERTNALEATQFNVVVKGMDTFPSDKYSMFFDRGYIRLRCDELDYEPENPVEKNMVNSYLTYTVSFKDSDVPSIVLCNEE